MPHGIAKGSVLIIINEGFVMKILVVGRGGREHSLLMHLAQSQHVEKLYVAPGNGGANKLATQVDISEMDIDQLVQFAKKEQIDLTVVGPENPLNAGIADRVQDRKSTRLNSSHVANSYAVIFLRKNIERSSIA